LRALPLHADVDTFLRDHERVYVIEQNRDAQLMGILRAELPQHWQKCHSVLNYDGLPIDAETILTQIQNAEGPRV
jgi:2-oxoglutarate ferredoxin oxidoreductase subunit alpha